MTQRSTSGGNVFTSSGVVFNWADWEALRAKYDLLNETVNNGASILSIRLEGLAATTDHHFVIDIPEGKQLVLFNRQLDVSEGRYFVDAISVTSIDLTTGVTNGITAPLNKVTGNAAGTILRHRAGGATGSVVREFGFIDTGVAIGAARSGGSSSVEGVVKILSGPSILRVRKTDTGVFTANLVFIAWETDL